MNTGIVTNVQESVLKIGQGNYWYENHGINVPHVYRFADGSLIENKLVGVQMRVPLHEFKVNNALIKPYVKQMAQQIEKQLESLIADELGLGVDYP